MGKTVRALLKIAINLLAKYCENTPVNHERFGPAIKVAMGSDPVRPQLFPENGFVHAEDIQPLKSNDDGHSFRLLHADGWWQVYSSYFGGRIGSFAVCSAPVRIFSNSPRSAGKSALPHRSLIVMQALSGSGR